MLGFLEAKIKNISKVYVCTFVSALIFGLFAHYFVIATKITNHDDMRQICDEMVDIKWGRWLLAYASDITGNMSLTFNCLLGLIFVALAAVVVVKTLKIRSLITAGFLGALFATFPTVTANNLYNSSADAYMLSALLTVTGAWAAVCIKNKIAAIIASFILFTASLGIYQGFFGLGLGLVILSGISALVFEQQKFKTVLLDEIRYAVTAAASLGAYLFISKTVQRVTGIAADDYQGLDKMGELDLAELPHAIHRSYSRSIGFFIMNKRGVHYDILTIPLIVVTIAAGIIFVVMLIKNKPGKFESALSVVLLALLPMGSGVIYLMGANSVHLLMIYGFIMLPVFLLMLVDRIEVSPVSGIKMGNIRSYEKVYQGLTLAVAALTIFNYITLANKVYTVQNFVYEESYAYAQTVASVIRTTPGYSTDSMIYMIGKPASKSIAIQEFFEDDPRLWDFKKTGIDWDLNTEYSVQNFYWYFLGMTNFIKVIDGEEAEDMGFDGLNVFPEDGSLMCTGKDIVIRFE